MIVPQAEINLVNGKHVRRRMMRVPVRYRKDGSQEPAPVTKRRAYRLQSRVGAKAQATITVTEIRREKLAAITDKDAKREAYAGIQGALQAWERTHGKPYPEQLVWVVSFVQGDESAFFDENEPVFLARSGDYTRSPSLSIPGEPQVIDPEVATRLAADAHKQRVDGQRLSLTQLAGHTETLRTSIANMKARQLLKKAVRNIEAAAALLPSDASLNYDGLHLLGAKDGTPRPLHGASLASPDIDQNAA